MTKNVFMIAGPNGAGKTTTALSLISNAIIIENPIIWKEIEEVAHAK